MIIRKFGMERLRVVDLKAIAKLKGLRGYSKLRKADLINLLTQRGERPEIIFIDEAEDERPEIIFIDEAEDEIPDQHQSEGEEQKRVRKAVESAKREVEVDDWGERLRKRKAEKKAEKRNRVAERRKREAERKAERKAEKKAKKRKRDAEERKRKAEKRKRDAEERKRKVEKRRKKRESKKAKRKKTQGPVDTHEKAKLDIDQLVKDVEEEVLRTKRKEAKSLFDVEKQIKRLKKKHRHAKGKRKRSLQKEIENKTELSPFRAR